jgi:hypothetical protein
MATATISPVVEMTAEHSRIHTAWLWMRELMRKARKGFASGAYKVRVTIIRAAGSTAAAVISAGTQIGLATRVGWDGAANLATKGLGLVAKGVVQIGRGASWVMDKIGKGFGWFAGLFSKKAGNAISDSNARFTGWRQNVLESAAAKIDGKVFIAHAAVTSKTASTVGRSYAGVLGVAGVANIATKGAVAAKAVSVLGPKAALLFGPVGLVATAVVGAVAGLFAWLFRRNEVATRAYELLVPEEDKIVKMENVQTTEKGDLIFDLTNDGGADIEGPSEMVDAVMSDPAAQAEAIMNAKLDQLKAAGLLPVDDTMIIAALVEEQKATPKADGTFAKGQMDRMRRLLRTGEYVLGGQQMAASA